jgi:hypothetical protein
MRHAGSSHAVVVKATFICHRTVSCRADQAPAPSAQRQHTLQQVVRLERGQFLMVIPAHRYARRGYMTVTDQQRMSNRLSIFPLGTLPTA